MPEGGVKSGRVEAQRVRVAGRDSTGRGIAGDYRSGTQIIRDDWFPLLQHREEHFARYHDNITVLKTVDCFSGTVCLTIGSVFSGNIVFFKGAGVQLNAQIYIFNIIHGNPNLS